MRLKSKVEHSQKEQGSRDDTIPDEYRGITISDQKLREVYGDINLTIAVYGGIHLSDNMRKFLQLPIGFRIFGRIEKVQAEKKAEESATSDRWDIRDRQEREQDGQRLSPIER